MIKNNYEKFGISEEVFHYVQSKVDQLDIRFKELDDIKEFNQLKILSAMQKNRLSAVDFGSTTGYGYGDQGREKTESIFKDIFHTEDALVRPLITSGTHALTLVLKAILRPNDLLISINGDPYDTLQEAIGITGNQPCNLMEFGIKYKSIPLKDDDIDLLELKKVLTEAPKLLMIQRSTGYSLRPALSLESIEKAIKLCRSISPDSIIMVDNCYGEFTKKIEPSDIGADLTVGSLIKNPGGGIALSGGYICGKKEYITLVAHTLTAPGLGKEVGLTFGTTRSTLQGLFFAPTVTIEALKCALLFAAVFRELGFEVIPDPKHERTDIIQAIVLKKPELVEIFCAKIQESAAVDGFVKPIAWDMPGYPHPVIMASGSFIDGSSIEISADAPMREPYCVYYQGGLQFTQGKLAVMKILEEYKTINILKIKKTL